MSVTSIVKSVLVFPFDPEPAVSSVPPASGPKRRAGV